MQAIAEGAGRLRLNPWAFGIFDLRYFSRTQFNARGVFLGSVAREAAIADARRKAEVYAQAAGIQLGRVEWVSEVSGFAPPAPMHSSEASAMTAASVPITGGEDTLRVRITVGFDIAR